VEEFAQKLDKICLKTIAKNHDYCAWWVPRVPESYLSSLFGIAQDVRNEFIGFYFGIVRAKILGVHGDQNARC
jgi:hypothetical protein